uniref:Uncharacterized protein n=1 Tax=Schistosoma mansoni TaxID=6183 RepID=A0A3Q0KUH9_SCHMA
MHTPTVSLSHVSTAFTTLCPHTPKQQQQPHTPSSTLTSSHPYNTTYSLHTITW